MHSKITSGEVPVTLDDEELILKPTLRAMTQISRQYGGLAKARAELVAENIDAIAFILRLGSGMGDRDAKDLGERIYATGVTAELIVPLIRYVGILGNGGKPFEGEEGDDSDSGSAKSGKARVKHAETDSGNV